MSNHTGCLAENEGYKCTHHEDGYHVAQGITHKVCHRWPLVEMDELIRAYQKALADEVRALSDFAYSTAVDAGCDIYADWEWALLTDGVAEAHDKVFAAEIAILDYARKVQL